MKTTRQEAVRALRDKGMSCIEIGKLLGVTRQRVYQILDTSYMDKRKKLYTSTR